jgi:hypothetical protein
MPILLCYYATEFSEELEFIGVCEYTKKTEFDVLVKAWCVAFDRDYKNIKWQHGYLNSLFQ